MAMEAVLSSPIAESIHALVLTVQGTNWFSKYWQQTDFKNGFSLISQLNRADQCITCVKTMKKIIKGWSLKFSLCMLLHTFVKYCVFTAFKKLFWYPLWNCI